MIKKYAVNVFSNQREYANKCEVFFSLKVITKQQMQNMASISHCAEVAFILEHNDIYSLRIFSPIQEMESCIHATLASLFVFQGILHNEGRSLYFQNEPLRGRVNKNVVKLPIRQVEGKYMNSVTSKPKHFLLFAAVELWTAKTSSGLQRMMIQKPTVRNVIDFNDQVITLVDTEFPHVESYFVYSAMDDSEQTFYGRMFAPKLGIKEDPVNGNSCVALFSQQRLKRPEISKIKFVQNHGASFTIQEKDGETVLTALCYFDDSSAPT